MNQLDFMTLQAIKLNTTE